MLLPVALWSRAPGAATARLRGPAPAEAEMDLRLALGRVPVRPSPGVVLVRLLEPAHRRARAAIREPGHRCLGDRGLVRDQVCLEGTQELLAVPALCDELRPLVDGHASQLERCGVGAVLHCLLELRACSSCACGGVTGSVEHLGAGPPADRLPVPDRHWWESTATDLAHVHDENGSSRGVARRDLRS